MFTFLAAFLMTVLILTKGDKDEKSSSHGSDLRNEFKALNFTEVQQQCNNTYKIEKGILDCVKRVYNFIDLHLCDNINSFRFTLDSI